MVKTEKNPIYILTEGDTQYVAVCEFGRRLTNAELKQVRDHAYCNFPWYECILSAITSTSIEKYT